MKYLAIIEGKDIRVVQWHKTEEAADKFLAQWLRDNRETMPYVRTTIAECIFTIEG